MIGLGDLVVCSSKAFREQAGLGLDVGIYLVDRKRDGLVFFVRPDRSEWIPKTALQVADPGDARLVAPPGWVVTVNAVVRLLAAIDLELEREEGGGFEVRVGCAGFERSTWSLLEDRLGPEACASLAIRPGSMSRVRVTWRVAPGSH